MIAPLEAAHEINRPLNKSALFKSSAVYQISRGSTRHYPRHLRFRQKNPKFPRYIWPDFLQYLCERKSKKAKTTKTKSTKGTKDEIT
jgi:hypothetical protein